MRLGERFEIFMHMLAAGVLGFICPDAFYEMWEELGRDIKGELKKENNEQPG